LPLGRVENKLKEKKKQQKKKFPERSMRWEPARFCGDWPPSKKRFLIPPGGGGGDVGTVPDIKLRPLANGPLQ